MSHSTHVGFNEPPTCVGLAPPFCPTFGKPIARYISPRGAPELFLPPQARSVGNRTASFKGREFVGKVSSERGAPFQSLADGVGHDPYSVSAVRGTNGARRNAMPFRIIPDLGQVPENGSHPPNKERCHVFQDRKFRSYQANGSNQFPVESRTLAGKSGAGPGETDVLTGEPAADDINGLVGPGKGSHVVVAGGCQASAWRARLGRTDRSHRTRRFAFRLFRARG